ILRSRLPYPLLWIAAVFASSIRFLQRLSLTRANGISLALLTIGVGLLLKRKYVWLAPLAFLYVWAYNLFALLLVAAACWTFAVFVTERRVEWRALFWALLGTGAGLVLNPYFPHDITLFITHLRMQTGQATGAGAEWLPSDTWTFLSYNGGAVLATAV